MAEWTQQAHVLADHALPGVLGAVSALHFDPLSELLWVGSASGQVTSHTNALPALSRCTSYAAHGTPRQPHEVRTILSDDKSILSLSDTCVRATQRSGLARWSIDIECVRATDRREHARGLRLQSMCPSPLSSSSDIFVGGMTAMAQNGQLTDSDVVLTINTNSGSVVRQAPAEAPLTHMRKSGRYLCTGTAQGTIQLRDPRTLAMEHKLSAHHGGLIDMQAEGHLLYSIGWTLRQGRRVAEPFIKAYDLRTMQPLVPIPMTAPGGPALLAVHPKKSSILAVATPQSQFQVLDTQYAGLSQFYSLTSNAYVTSMAFSPSAEALAFGESDGSVRLWTSGGLTGAVRFNSYPTAPLPMPDPVSPPPVVEWRSDTPLSCIGMPHYKEHLLSSPDYETLWSDASPLFTVPMPLDKSVLEQAVCVQGLAYAPLPRHLCGTRNQLAAADQVLTRFDRAGRLKPGAAMRLRSGRGTRRIRVPFRSEQDDGTEALEAQTDDAWNPTGPKMPAYYAQMTIQYSKFGVEDFDFAYYNKTAYSGLETNIGAAYANSLLQALHYARPFRAFAKRHIMLTCTADDCLLCEAGFLFRMLEDAQGTNCQASNFLRVLARSPQAATLGLLDQGALDVPYAHLVQRLHHYLLDQVSQRALRTGALLALPPIELVLCANPSAWSMMVHSQCGTCGHTATRQQLSHVVDLLYPSGPARWQHDLAALLSLSICREALAKMTCRQCGTAFSPHKTWRTLVSTDALPAMLCVNAGVLGAEQLAYWVPRGTSRGFVPPRLAMQVDRGHVRAAGLRDEPCPAQAALYMLRAMIVQVQGAYDAPHLCTYVRGPGADPDEWVLFNDFLVRRVEEAEVLHFGASWKIPAVLVWERVDCAAQAHAAQLEDRAQSLCPDTTLLTRDWNMAAHRNPEHVRHRLLTEDELPQPGTLVAIDAEFVSLANEELEIFSDGTRSLLQPSHLALARVSVLRGEGPAEGEPFIDDHIHTTEPVVDYLTQFSGIQPGDLAPATTQVTLVPHKIAYKKLRWLVDRGCRFIGHGLAKDFRIINLYVPPSQVIDTVQLYHSPAHPRKLSLRFLSWFLLKQDIQKGLKIGTEGNEAVHEGHDSIEDAAAALQLYRRYA
ncbi:poly(A)-specific ribonuclease [Malassezia nana]|uniref:Poly(A)-specific ribonuclease n=1 Tax=Malassezia nana TaxID=180528 RepID=A0AAF0EP03_9BASI|nr:poly(A)-specific ribonuclease [Malassezia nana]